MGSERQSPDAILDITNLTPNDVTYVQDDPDIPDGNWLVADGNSVNVDVRTSFATPTGSPTVGIDLQEFRVWVRQFDTGQTGDPTCRIELWDNGALVRVSSDVTITGSGQILSFTWNANELGTANGSLVECKIVGTKSGGSPSKRNAVDVGAIEWNVVYDEVSAYYPGLKVQGEGELALCDVGTNPLRIRKGGVTYGIELVETNDPNASRIRIKTGAGIKAIRKYT